MYRVQRLALARELLRAPTLEQAQRPGIRTPQGRRKPMASSPGMRVARCWRYEKVRR